MSAVIDRNSSLADLDATVERMDVLRQRGRSGLLCGGVAGGVPASSNLLDHGLLSLLPAALAVIAFIGAFTWMMRRWGARPSTAPAGAPALTLPAPAPEHRGERTRVPSRSRPAATCGAHDAELAGGGVAAGSSVTTDRRHPRTPDRRRGDAPHAGSAVR